MTQWSEGCHTVEGEGLGLGSKVKDEGGPANQGYLPCTYPLWLGSSLTSVLICLGIISSTLNDLCCAPSLLIEGLSFCLSLDKIPLHPKNLPGLLPNLSDKIFPSEINHCLCFYYT